MVKVTKLLVDYKDSSVCLVSYETREELLKAFRRLGAEMARTGIGLINTSEESTNKEQVENASGSEPIPITIDLERIFNSLTPENDIK